MTTSSRNHTKMNTSELDLSPAAPAPPADGPLSSCSQVFNTLAGEPVTVTFGDDGMPSVAGMTVACARHPMEVAIDGEAWIHEAQALHLLGFKIVDFINIVVIFKPN